MTQIEALAEAKRLVRRLGSAPDPMKEARAMVGLLLRAGPWSAAAERQILGLADWLATRPSPAALRPRCQQVLKTLE